MQIDGRHAESAGARRMFALLVTSPVIVSFDQFPFSMSSWSRLLLLFFSAVLFPLSAFAGGADAGFDPERLGRSIIYPVEAVLAGREGSVLMRVLVQPDGSASKIEWRDGDDTLLASAVFRALVDYRFSPSGRDSERSEGWIYIPVRFSLESIDPEVDTAGRPIVAVVPALRSFRDAPVVAAQSLGRLVGRTTGVDTTLPSVSKNALRKNLYYPDMARFNRFEGTVLVHAQVDTKGGVTSAYPILSDNTIFDDAALEAVRKSRFTPGRVSGRATSLWTFVPVTFDLDGR